jgi:UDP-2-acetamido-2-deoxy-ribo-hexuluronate aminotransferase
MLYAPCIPKEYKSVWAQYSILPKYEEHRSTIQTNLKDAGIPKAIYYLLPLYLQIAFKSIGYNDGDFPISEDCSCRIFSLPMHPYLKTEDQQTIAQVVGKTGIDKEKK